jgi:hypothetical protein
MKPRYEMEHAYAPRSTVRRNSSMETIETITSSYLYPDRRHLVWIDRPCRALRLMRCLDGLGVVVTLCDEWSILSEELSRGPCEVVWIFPDSIGGSASIPPRVSRLRSELSYDGAVAVLLAFMDDATHSACLGGDINHWIPVLFKNEEVRDIVVKSS